MPHPLLIYSQSDNLIQVVDTNSHTKWQTVQIQISWLLQKPTDLDLHCLQNGISGFSRTKVQLSMLGKYFSWWYFEIYFFSFIFFQKIKSSTVCSNCLSLWRLMICMICQNIYSGKNKKNILICPFLNLSVYNVGIPKCSLLNFFPSMLSIIILGLVHKGNYYN